MYPETDVPPVEPDLGDVPTPELLTEKADRYAAEHGLDEGLAEQVARGQRWPVYEDAVERGVDPTLAATTVESTLTELRRDGVAVEAVGDDQLLDALAAVEDGTITQDHLPELLEHLADHPDTDADAAIDALGLEVADRSAVEDAVERVVERNADQVETEGMGAFSALMGEAMGELGGDADGEVVSEALRSAIQARE